jgi:putative copper resistance protein D
MLSRFSTLGTVAVGMVAATGILSAVLIVRDMHVAIAAPYGRVLITKFCLVLLMTGLAADNRWRLSSAIRGATAHHAIRRLTQNVALEIGFGVLVLGLVGVLGTLSPG